MPLIKKNLNLCIFRDIPGRLKIFYLCLFKIRKITLQQSMQVLSVVCWPFGTQPHHSYTPPFSLQLLPSPMATYLFLYTLWNFLSPIKFKIIYNKKCCYFFLLLELRGRIAQTAFGEIFGLWGYLVCETTTNPRVNTYIPNSCVPRMGKSIKEIISPFIRNDFNKMKL